MSNLSSQFSAHDLQDFNRPTTSAAEEAKQLLYIKSLLDAITDDFAECKTMNQKLIRELLDKIF